MVTVTDYLVRYRANKYIQNINQEYLRTNLNAFVATRAIPTTHSNVIKKQKS